MSKSHSFYRGFATIIALIGLVILAAGVLVPTVRGWTPLTVLTGSMLPKIRPGDVVVMEPVDGRTVRVGDVVAYRPADSTQTLITHRVIEVRRAGDSHGEDQVIVKGDNNDTPDEPLVASQVVGRLVYVAPGIGFFVSTVGKIVVLALIATLLWADGLFTRRLSHKPASVRSVAATGGSGSKPPDKPQTRPNPTPASTPVSAATPVSGSGMEWYTPPPTRTPQPAAVGGGGATTVLLPVPAVNAWD